MAIKIFDAPYTNELGKAENLSENGDGFMRDGNFFFTGEKGGWLSCDWLIVCESPYACFFTDIPRERRILFTMEPPEIRQYENYLYYLEQFGTVIAREEIPGYSGEIIISSPHLGWFAGARGELGSISAMKNYLPPQKTKTISIITSLQQKTTYHKKRVEFLRAAQKEFSGILECFGRDFNPINDKLEAIAPYKYNIVIENSRHKLYWTEKLMDAWAGWSLPIYCGDPEILKEIPDKNGLVIIDVEDVENSLKKIHEAIDGNFYEENFEAIKICREWAIKNSNRYELACDVIANSHDDTPKLSKPELLRVFMSKRKNFAYNAIKKFSPVLAEKIFEAYYRKKGRIWE